MVILFIACDKLVHKQCFVLHWGVNVMTKVSEVKLFL
jgi:hypothetical protein